LAEIHDARGPAFFAHQLASANVRYRGGTDIR
jgi:hypothetical protein